VLWYLRYERLLRRLAVLAALGLGAALPGTTLAEWTVSGDIEHFRWREALTPSVTETGARYGVGGTWLPSKNEGWLLGWKGRLYGGSVDYDGSELFGGAPVRSTTGYRGMLNEFRAVYRPGGTRFGALDLVSGMGFDIWERTLSARQNETYTVAFLRLGVDYGMRSARGWFGGGGVKQPLFVREYSRLRGIGFVQDPILHPRGEASVYGQLGYRWSSRWSVAAYYDGMRFGRSPAEPAPLGGATFAIVQPKSSMDVLGLRLAISF
jgi:hypothetical protein